MNSIRIWAFSAAIGVAGAITTTAIAQDANTPPAAATPPADAIEELPAVNVVQETPVQKAARAKKKAVAVSPLSNAPSTPAPTVATSAGNVAAAAPETSTIETPLPTVPSASTTVTDDDLKREGTMQVQQALQQNVPGIVISDAAGNPLRAEVSFRGFDASPVSGRSQGLAVYQNGVRINESFGDTVQWDVIPSNAIAGMSVVSNNPSFGLNALGGAVSVLMKDGFSYQGGEIDVMAGSFGRAQVGIQAGISSGGVGLYVAGEGLTDDSFRDFSDSEVKRFYGDLGFKGDGAEVHFSLTAAKNHFGASAAAPVELLERSWSNTFTTPQTTDLEVLMPTVSGTIKATDTLSFSGVGYYRHYKNRVLDGNVTEADECRAGNTNDGLPGGVANRDFLCLDDGDGEVLRNAANFQPINTEDEGLDEPFGTLDRL
nr:TonB-dependent receptor plug domain-containing protein [Hyphomicrobium sp.]